MRSAKKDGLKKYMSVFVPVIKKCVEKNVVLLVMSQGQDAVKKKIFVAINVIMTIKSVRGGEMHLSRG
jgi:hypothetical protein